MAMKRSHRKSVGEKDYNLPKDNNQSLDGTYTRETPGTKGKIITVTCHYVIIINVSPFFERLGQSLSEYILFTIVTHFIFATSGVV